MFRKLIAATLLAGLLVVPSAASAQISGMEQAEYKLQAVFNPELSAHVPTQLQLDQFKGITPWLKLSEVVTENGSGLKAEKNIAAFFPVKKLEWNKTLKAAIIGVVICDGGLRIGGLNVESYDLKVNEKGVYLLAVQEKEGKLSYHLVNPKGTLSQQIHEPKLSAHTPLLKAQVPTLKKFKVEIKENTGHLKVYDAGDTLKAHIRLSFDNSLSAAQTFGLNTVGKI